VGTEAAATLLLALIHEQHYLTSAAGEFRAFVTSAYPEVRGPAEEPLPTRRVQGSRAIAQSFMGVASFSNSCAALRRASIPNSTWAAI